MVIYVYTALRTYRQNVLLKYFFIPFDALLELHAFWVLSEATTRERIGFTRRFFFGLFYNSGQCSLPLRRWTAADRKSTVVWQSPRVDRPIGSRVKHLYAIVVGERGRYTSHIRRHRGVGNTATAGVGLTRVRVIFGRIGFVKRSVD